MQLARDAGVPVYLDAGGMEGPLDPQVLSCLSLLSPNETELSRLTGMPTNTEQEVRLCCTGGMRLASQGRRGVWQVTALTTC